MALQGWFVKRCERSEISKFIETWHYSKSINGCISDYCYALYSDVGEMKGAMFFGRMAMAGQWKRFADSEGKVIELRRLCCANETPRNAESFFIGRAIRMLRKDWRNNGVVVSYADAEHGHVGTIYKASNFKYLGFKKGARVIEYEGKRYHDKAIRTKNKGVLKPFAIRLRDALHSGLAKYVSTAGKHTFVYEL